MKNQCENITCLSISLIQSCYFFVVVVFLLSFCGWKCTVCCPIGGWNFVLVPRYQSLDRPVKRRRWILKKILTYLLHHSPFKCPSQFWKILTTPCQLIDAKTKKSIKNPSINSENSFDWIFKFVWTWLIQKLGNQSKLLAGKERIQ